MNLRLAPTMLATLLGVSSFASTFSIRVFNFEYGVAPPVQSDPVVEVGDTVRWVWDSNFHSTTSAAGMAESWDSGVRNTGATFDHTFTNVGSYGYYCNLHGADLGGGNVTGMAGFVHVGNTSLPFIVRPFRGLLVSGTVADVATSDNQYLTYQRGFVVNQSEMPIQIFFDCTSNVLNPSVLAVNLEDGVNSVGLMRRVEILNTQTNALELLEQTAARQADKTSQYILSGDRARFVNQTDGKVTVKVSYFATGPVTVSAFQARFDRLAVVVK